MTIEYYIRDDGVLFQATNFIRSDSRFRKYIPEETPIPKPILVPKEEVSPKVDTSSFDSLDPDLMSREQLIQYGQSLGLKVDKRLSRDEVLRKLKYDLERL